MAVHTGTRLHRTLEHQREAVRLEATADKILAKARLAQANVKKLVDHNAP